MISRSYRLLPDERLARLAGDGNDPAFAALHHRYDAILHGYTRSIARDADDAADALQNAWIAALVALRADRRQAPVRPWLFRIAHNAAVDVLRRKASASSVVRSIDRGVLACVPGVDEQYARTETMAEVVGDMRELPTNQRAALVMRELADLDYGEIAIALSTSEGNARQLVFAARDGLRESRAGRALPCDAVRGVLARADGRELRRRRLRAHLDVCQGCRAYAAGVTRPARKVAGYAPGPALLQGIFAAAGGSGAAMTSGGSFAGLAKGAVAAVLVVAGVGTGEAVVHHRGGQSDGESAGSATADTSRTARAAGALVAEPDPRPAPPPARNVSARVVQRASARATRVVPLALARDTRRAPRASRAVAGDPGRRQSRAVSTSPGSRSAPGSDAEPRAGGADPHIGGRRGGADGAGPRGDGEAPRDDRRTFGDPRGARDDGARAGVDCDPQAADASASGSSLRERIPSFR